MRMQVPANEIRLADVILLENINAYHTATVKKISEGVITLFRPYVQTADFSMGESVICYIGIEEWNISPRKGEKFTVLERKELA
jgi:hypothetical protein